MIDTLAANPLLLLFLVAAVGYPLGRLKVYGFSLGIAAVLFVGLAFGALDPRLGLPEIIYQFGLVVFIYTVGLASGGAFFASFRRQGVRDNLLVLALLVVGAGLALLGSRLFGLSSATTAGMFAGSLTNTPALAGVLEALGRAGEVAAEPVVAYAVTYPVGVIGVILVIVWGQLVFKPDYAAEALALRDLGVSGENLQNLTVRVTREGATEVPVHDLREQQGWSVILGRFRRGGVMQLVHADTVLSVGDEVSLIGTDGEIRAAAAFLGDVTKERLEFDRSDLDFRRIFVSNPQVVDKTLEQLALPESFGALVTRVRRGDSDHLPTGATRLELGDRVRVVSRREQFGGLASFFGDSQRALAEIDVLVFSLGVACGLLVGLVPVPLPGGVIFRLGLAGGPLLVALCLGALGRTGRVVWTLPYTANLTLRQLGLVLFLAGVGTRSGYAFVTTLSGAQGLSIFAAGLVITLTTSALLLVVGHKGLGIPMGVLIGMLAGLQTQPAVLGFANERTQNELPNLGYATVFPLATIAKILLAQLLLAVSGQAQ